MPKQENEGMLDDDNSALSADGNAMISTQAILNFIDLAGSERANIHDSSSKTSVTVGATIRNPSPYGSTHRSNSNNKGGMGATSQRQKEGQHINKSLFFLTQVIAMQAEGK